MDIPFLVMLGIYMLVMVGISVADSCKTADFKSYAVAGKDQRLITVTMTLMATILGASTTIGITDTVYQIGFPGIWWLAFGAVGLLLQSLLLSERVRGMNADTLPHLTEMLAGRSASFLLALIIVISWIGVVAGQLVALGGLVTFATGKDSKILLAVVAVLVILYTTLGGQLSVVKTDRIQLVVIIAGILLCFGYLFGTTEGSFRDATGQIEFFNESYTVQKWITQFFVIGGVFFLGPDILSRNFIAKDGRTAKRSALLAAGSLLIFAVIISMIGVWARLNVPAEELGGNKTLLYVARLLPGWMRLIMSLGLMSAILSSTDTCLINAASIFSRDILRKEDKKIVRFAVLGIGALALGLTLLSSGNIINILSGAYSIYTPGVIFPLLVAIFSYKKRNIRKKLWMTGVCAGGLCGVMSTFCGEWMTGAGVPSAIVDNLTLIGMGLSLIFSLLSVIHSGSREQ